MCKRIKDILWPLNVLGSKVRSIKYKLPDGGTITVQVVWEGKRLQMCYTHLRRAMDWEYRKTYVTPVKHVKTNGTEINEEITRGMRGRFYNAVGAFDSSAPEHNVIYFKCTNVTKLIVNGEQII